MDHFQSLERFRYRTAPLRPINWLGFDHNRRPPCDFKEYPICRGWTQSYLTELKSQPIDDTFCIDVLPMLQSWLFVGALESLIGDRIQTSDFLRTKRDRPVISTQFLTPLLSSWEDSVEMLPLPQREMLSEKIHIILSETQFWCFKLASSSGLPVLPLEDSTGPLSPTTDVDSTCRLLALIGETINTARTYLHTPTLPNAKGFLGAYTIQEENRLVSRLVKAGWCPFMARILPTFRYNIAEYASFWPKKTPKFGMAHSHCSLQQCVAYDIDTSTYKPRHDSPNCTCSRLIPPVQDVVTLLAAGKVPVMSFMRQDTPIDGHQRRISLCVHDAASTGHTGGYAAISHVWSDGIGSNTENGLPCCVVERLFERARAYGREYIWIDSLCIPAEHEPRKKAIELMGETYSNADITLVLDSQIRRISFDLDKSPIELTLLLLITSPWMQRLWTLQEAILSTTLIFQFQNTLASATDVYLAIYKTVQRRLNPVTQVLGNECFKLLQLSSLLPQVLEQDSRLEFGDLYRMLRMRKTSKARDETPAIARLLGVDLPPLLEVQDPETRMRRFLVLLRKLPCDIIFTSRPRMNIRGFFWAPTSLMMNNAVASDKWGLTTGDRVQWAECLEHGGLRGKYQVFLLSRQVTVRHLTPIIVSFGGKILKIMMAKTGADRPIKDFEFNCYAMLPHLGNVESLKLAAALFSTTDGDTTTYEYRGRIMIGDSNVYQGQLQKKASLLRSIVQVAAITRRF